MWDKAYPGYAKNATAAIRLVHLRGVWSSPAKNTACFTCGPRTTASPLSRNSGYPRSLLTTSRSMPEFDTPPLITRTTLAWGERHPRGRRRLEENRGCRRDAPHPSQRCVLLHTGGRKMLRDELRTRQRAASYQPAARSGHDAGEALDSAAGLGVQGARDVACVSNLATKRYDRRAAAEAARSAGLELRSDARGSACPCIWDSNPLTKRTCAESPLERPRGAVGESVDAAG